MRLLYGREPVAAVFHLAASCSGCLLDVSTRVVVLGVGTNLPGDPRKQNGSGCRGAQRGGIWLERCRPGAVRLRPDQNAARRGRVPFPPRPPGDAQGGHARACAQHNGRRARRGARRRRNGAGGVVAKGRQEHPGRPEAARILDERSGNIFEDYERRLRELVSALQDRLRTMFRVATTRPAALATARDPVGCVLPEGVVDTLLGGLRGAACPVSQAP